MAGITRKVHLKTAFDYGSIDKFAPDMQCRVPPENGGGVPVTPNAICFCDPDGETHVFILDEDGRKALISKLCGGVIVGGAR